MLLRAGERLTLGLAHRTTSEAFPVPLPATELDDAQAVTIASWRAWSRIHQGYQGPWQELVHHSGRVLQALSYQPTGAVASRGLARQPPGAGRQRRLEPAAARRVR